MIQISTAVWLCFVFAIILVVVFLFVFEEISLLNKRIDSLMADLDYSIRHKINKIEINSNDGIDTLKVKIVMLERYLKIKEQKPSITMPQYVKIKEISK